MHLTDADLIRHLDGEGEIARRQVWTEHMEGCVICAHRFRDMERTSETFSSLLRAAEFEVAPGATGAAATANAAPPKAGVFETGTGAATLPAPDAMPGARPTPWRRLTTSPWLRAAVIVLLVAAPLTAVPPVREWVLSRVSMLTPTPPPAVTSTGAAGAPAIRFQPAPGVFTLRVDPQPAGSTLTLGVSPTGDAILESAPGTGEAARAVPAPVVSESMLRLPSADAPAMYELRVPSTVTAVRLVRDGSTVELDARSLEAGTTLTF